MSDHINFLAREGFQYTTFLAVHAQPKMRSLVCGQSTCIEREFNQVFLASVRGDVVADSGCYVILVSANKVNVVDMLTTCLTRLAKRTSKKRLPLQGQTVALSSRDLMMSMRAFEVFKVN